MTTKISNKKNIETALKNKGIDAEIIKGNGYFYLVGKENSYLDVGRYST